MKRRPRPRPGLRARGGAVGISGLTKAYGNGELAVNDLSFRVERGQVLGLLGPNGAGKTTTLRMLMGLIHPDAGEVRIFGHRVAPAPRSCPGSGSFVEGPGFLPHLSGRDNLELYWKATGRPTADAQFAEALEIAGLGKALERRRADLLAGHAAAAGHRPGHARPARPAASSTSPPTGSTHPRSVRCARC